MTKTLRAFVALILPEEIVDYLVRIQRSLKSKGVSIGWVRPENLHLTIKFLGDMPESDVPRAADALQKAVDGMPAFELTVQGMGVFPGIKRPRVLWVGLGGAPHLLKQLHGRLEAALEPMGVMPDKRGFTAHLTLGRIRKRIDPNRLLTVMVDAGGFAPKSFFAQRLALFKSDLQPRGAIYTPLSEVVLTAEERMVQNRPHQENDL
jgi:2'-5' RNA ligase